MLAVNGTKSPIQAFTPEQEEKIDQLRERMRNELIRKEQEEGSYLVKWLIARKFDLDQAEDMLRKHCLFMKVNGLDDMENTYKPPEIAEYFHTAMLGYDNEGSIVRILHVGGSDLRGLCMGMSKLDCLKHATYVLLTDHYKQERDRANDTICDKHVYILDLQGLSWRAIIQRIVVDRAYVLLKSYEANHPERLKVAYIVNAPSFFSFIYSWLKTVLPESIISKLDILSQDDCKSKLASIMDPSILPASLGGTRTDPDGNPTCQSLYPKPLGQPIPEKLIPTDQLEALKNDPDAKRVIVDFRSIFIAEKLITEPNVYLQWDFQTVDYDIRMGLRYKKDEESESIEIIPTHRVDSHIFPESGKLLCENLGLYELVFDNTYSWMTSKELIFKVSLGPPPKNFVN